MIVCGLWQKIQTAVFYVFTGIAVTFALFCFRTRGALKSIFDTTR